MVLTEDRPADRAGRDRLDVFVHVTAQPLFWPPGASLLAQVSGGGSQIRRGGFEENIMRVVHDVF
jgi:hypothetical protein